MSFWDDYTPFGFLDGGSSSESKSLTAAEKRAVLLGAARQFGVDSIEYRAFAKRWKKQARALEKLGGLPEIGTGSVREGDVPLQPIYDPFGSARGIPVAGPAPPSPEFLRLAFELLSGLASFAGASAILKGGAAALKALLKRRASMKNLEDLLGKAGAKKAIALEKIEARKLEIKDLAKARGTQRASTPRGTTTKTDTAREKAKKLVEKIKATRIIPAPIIYAPRGDTPTADPGGAMPGSGAAAAPTAAERARVIVGDIKATARAGAGPGATGAGGARARAPVAVKDSPLTRAREKALQRAAVPFAGPVPQWLQILLDSVEKIGFPEKSKRESAAETPAPAPLPVPNPGLTPFGSGGVGLRQCECGPKKPRKPRKRRSVCYTGRFTESATGTRKYDKRKRTTCQPSRKKR